MTTFCSSPPTASQWFGDKFVKSHELSFCLAPSKLFMLHRNSRLCKGNFVIFFLWFLLDVRRSNPGGLSLLFIITLLNSCRVHVWVFTELQNCSGWKDLRPLSPTVPQHCHHCPMSPNHPSEGRAPLTDIFGRLPNGANFLSDANLLAGVKLQGFAKLRF